MNIDRFDASKSDQGRYRMLVDAIFDYAIYMLDPEGRVISWNAGAQRFKGYEAAEIIGEHFSRFYTDEDRAAGVPANALRTALHEGRFEAEGWRVRKDGGRFWAHVVIDPVRAPTGELMGFAKITRDLTERRQAEQTLRRSEEQFRLLVQGVTDYAIYMLDLDGRVSSWNAGAERIKGFRAHEIIGEHFSRFYTDEERASGAPAAALKTAISEGRFEKEGWRVRKDGGRFWAHVVIDAIRDDHGEVIGLAKITRDVTERMRAQSELAEAREALLQTQKLEAIGQLTGGVAHDFNNLLMAVLGSLALLRKHMPDNPKALALLENAVQGAERGAALTKRMLAFARKQELKPEALDLAALVHGMVGLLERSIGPTVQLSTSFDRALPRVLADANQLETALLNLAVNARDAMPNGGRITIEARSRSIASSRKEALPAGEYVALSVMDEGEGMDAETLARATEPFFTTKELGKGTGLGLSMVHGLAVQSGGRLSIASRPGEGARIELLLPVACATSLAEIASCDEEAPMSERSLLVLAVDDDGLVLMNTVAMVEDLGHQVIAARSASEALALLGDNPVDLVLTDYAMPQKSGLELGREIRARRPGMPIILTSGYAELSAGEGGEILRLAKPYSQSDLARALHAVLAAQELTAA
jgi:PAS domain S-box-containing protein